MRFILQIIIAYRELQIFTLVLKILKTRWTVVMKSIIKFKSAIKFKKLKMKLNYLFHFIVFYLFFHVKNKLMVK